MLDFTAIDFETANKYYNSACSLAAVSVRDYETVREGYTLIRPPYMSFSPDNIRIHGITPDQVRDKPKFDALWDRVRPHLEGRILVAHYAVFDTRVLRSLLKTYELEPWTTPGPAPSSSARRRNRSARLPWKNSWRRRASP